LPDSLSGFKDYLKRVAFESGATLFGIADINVLSNGKEQIPKLFTGYNRAVSIAFRLSAGILSTITDSPTKIYAHHYKQVNYLLDRIALRIAGILQFWGYNSIPLPASQITDWDNITGNVSHKTIAQLAGLGFIGRNHLLITSQYGAQIRLVSVATDCPLPPDNPTTGECGKCFKCVKICPAEAIGKSHEKFNLEKCREMLKTFAKKGIGQYICGICVKVCSGMNNNS